MIELDLAHAVVEAQSGGEPNPRDPNDGPGVTMQFSLPAQL